MSLLSILASKGAQNENAEFRLKETPIAGRHRPAQLFRFDQKRYEQLRKRGFKFEV